MLLATSRAWSEGGVVLLARLLSPATFGKVIRPQVVKARLRHSLQVLHRAGGDILQRFGVEWIEVEIRRARAVAFAAEPVRMLLEHRPGQGSGQQVAADLNHEPALA